MGVLCEENYGECKLTEALKLFGSIKTWIYKRNPYLFNIYYLKVLMLL